MNVSEQIQKNRKNAAKKKLFGGKNRFFCLNEIILLKRGCAISIPKYGTTVLYNK